MDIESSVAQRSGPLLYILAMAHQEAVQAFLELAKVDPTKPDEIRRWQFAIERYSNFEIWLSHAVSEGSKAFKDMSPEVVEEWVQGFSASDEDYE